MSLSAYFLSPVQLKMGSDNAAWWVPDIQTRSTHHMVLGIIARWKLKEHGAVADESVWPVGQQRKGGGIRLCGTRVGLNVGLELLIRKVMLCGLRWDRGKDGVQVLVWRCRMCTRGVSDVGLAVLIAVEQGSGI